MVNSAVEIIFVESDGRFIVDRKILLADDSVTVQKIIALTFSDESVEVIAAPNGDEAIDLLRRIRPSLVMADISVPGRNGYEICEFVKTHPEMKETPVILLVPAFEDFDEERARRAGADCHLTKPFQSIRTLISVVKNLIDRKAVAGDDSAAVREVVQGKYNTAELNTRRAKIDELIKLSAQPNGDNGMIEDVDMDNILELDDVLPNLAPASMGHVGHLGPMGLNAPAVPYETQEETIVPQSVIDEIVNRVSAQLSARLIERLSGEIARRIAPEVAELVKRQLFAGHAPYREPENLLDIE